MAIATRLPKGGVEAGRPLASKCAAANDDRLARIGAAAEERGYRSHEFCDSLLIERGEAAARVLVDPNYGRPGVSVVFIH